MAVNPMKRKTRTSFLLGMVITLLITGAIIAFLFMQLSKLQEEQKKEQEALKSVYVLNQDVVSGQIITSDLLTKKNVNKDTIPDNAIYDASILESYSLQDENGNELFTRFVKDDENGDGKDNENEKIYSVQCIKQYDEETKKIIVYELGEENVLSEEESEKIYYITEFTGTEVEGENYYFRKQNQNTTEEKTIKLLNNPLIARVDMDKNSVLTLNLLNKSDEIVTDDIRKQEYNMIALPMDLTSGEYVDIRLMLPSGKDYIVLSKKMVEVPQIAGIDSTNTIYLNLSEDEILLMSSAIVEAYWINGAKLYATKYVEAGMQEAAELTYPVNIEVLDLMYRDSNIVKKAIDELNTRYNSTVDGDDTKYYNNQRNYLNNEINNNQDAGKSNVETKMQESITTTKQERQQYLEGI